MRLPRLITRRRVKWVGTCASALIALLGIGSVWYWVQIRRDYHFHDAWRIAMSDGGVHVLQMTGTLPVGGDEQISMFRFTHGAASNPGIVWLPDRSRDFHSLGSLSYKSQSVTIPLWLPLLLVAAPTAWLWCTDRRAKPWQCPKCRYDLRGLGGVRRKSGEVDSKNRPTVCPECGSVVDHSNRGEPSAD